MAGRGVGSVWTMGLCLICLILAGVFTVALFNDSWRFAVAFSVLGLLLAVPLAVRRGLSVRLRVVAIALVVSLLAVCINNFAYGFSR